MRDNTHLAKTASARSKPSQQRALGMPYRHARAWAVFGMFLLAFFITGRAQAQPARHALVIGISNYQHIGVLANPVRDAKDMAVKLASLGFTVHPPVIDGTREDMESSLREFKLKVKSGDEVVLYYSGHAVQRAATTTCWAGRAAQRAPAGRPGGPVGPVAADVERHE